MFIPFLSSLQLADSFFPSGLYALSYGLETFLQTHQAEACELDQLLADYLRFSIGTTESIALACAHRASEEADVQLAIQADRRLAAVKLAREAREASLRTGHQLLAVSKQVFGGVFLQTYLDRVSRKSAPGNYAIVLGLTMSALGVPRVQAIAGELYAFASSFVAAAVRLTVIDYRIAQSILHQSKPVIAEVADQSCQKGVRDIASCAPLIDIMAMRHEQAEIRLFMS